jgi:hypothetical protein
MWELRGVFLEEIGASQLVHVHLEVFNLEKRQ